MGFGGLAVGGGDVVLGWPGEDGGIGGTGGGGVVFGGDVEGEGEEGVEVGEDVGGESGGVVVSRWWIVTLFSFCYEGVRDKRTRLHLLFVGSCRNLGPSPILHWILGVNDRWYFGVRRARQLHLSVPVALLSSTIYVSR